MSNAFYILQQVWQNEMIEGIIEGQEEEEEEGGEGEGECDEDGEDILLPNKRPILASNRKTVQRRRREGERKTKVHHFN